jgi:hypothetical protein
MRHLKRMCRCIVTDHESTDLSRSVHFIYEEELRLIVNILIVNSITSSSQLANRMNCLERFQNKSGYQIFLETAAITSVREYSRVQLLEVLALVLLISMMRFFMFMSMAMS